MPKTKQFYKMSENGTLFDPDQNEVSPEEVVRKLKEEN